MAELVAAEGWIAGEIVAVESWMEELAVAVENWIVELAVAANWIAEHVPAESCEAEFAAAVPDYPFAD